MIIFPLTSQDSLWRPTADFADSCSWRAGKWLAEQMHQGSFSDWERVFVAVDEERIMGFCTLAKTDCIVDVPYTPYVGYVFVDEAFRGHRLSEKLIVAAADYARTLGFDRVYLVSDHENLYERFGFVKIDEKPAPWNPDVMESIFARDT